MGEIQVTGLNNLSNAYAKLVTREGYSVWGFLRLI